MSKSKQVDNNVPVLDKGNYNNKKNLLYFMEQEVIAAKMIEEARSFYDNFLESKTTKFKDILKYPNIYFIKPRIYAYYRKAWMKKWESGGYSNEYGDHPEDNLAIEVSFSVDLGSLGYGSNVWDNFISITTDYTDSWNGFNKEYYERFNDKTLTDDLRNRYKAFENKLHKYHYVCDVTVQELIDLGIHNPNDSYHIDYRETNYGKNRNIFAELCIPLSRYETVYYSRVTPSSKYTEYSDDFRDIRMSRLNSDSCSLLKDHPVIKKYIEEEGEKLNKEFKPLFISMMNNLKGWEHEGKKYLPGGVESLYNTKFLFTREGDIIELLTNEIDSTSFDKQKGLYTIKCKTKVQTKAKYAFPSDGPRVRTEYYQEFIFDVATNDLVDYEFHHESQTIQYK